MVPDLRCSKCEGNRVVRGKTVVEVEVVKGMVDGQKIVFDHEGDQASGMESGDVVVVLHEHKHDIFARNYLDLTTVVKVGTFIKPISFHPISFSLPSLLYQIGLTEALTGFQRPILTLDGRTLLINTVKGEVVIIKSFSNMIPMFCA